MPETYRMKGAEVAEVPSKVPGEMDVLLKPFRDRPTRRVHVHRRPKRRSKLLRYLFLAALVFTTIGLFVDIFHPRYLATDVNVDAPICSPPDSQASRPRIRSLNAPPFDEKLICWSLVEQKALIKVPWGLHLKRILIPASWASLRWYTLPGGNGTAIAKRFLPAYVDSSFFPEDTIYAIEYASGFIPALMLQRGLFESLVAFSPEPLLRTFREIVVQSIRYTSNLWFPKMSGKLSGARNAGVRGATCIANIIDRPFKVARRLAHTVRKRRQK